MNCPNCGKKLPKDAKFCVECGTKIENEKETTRKGNILVVGNSGVGKSTLINAVLGEDKAKTGVGSKGVTSELEIYENDVVPFRLIDTMGFEPGIIDNALRIMQMKFWGVKKAIDSDNDNDVTAVWFCIDGSSGRVFSDTIDDFLSLTDLLWKDLPIVIVITKSLERYKIFDYKEIIHKSFENHKRTISDDRIIPVVAQSYCIDDEFVVAPHGIEELVQETYRLVIDEGFPKSDETIENFKLKSKRYMAHGLVVSMIGAGAAIGAIPIPFSDAILLTPIETGMINGLAKIYGVEKNTNKPVLSLLVEAGTVGALAKAAISALKAIPGIGLATSALNAVIAGGIIAALGEASILVFENIYLGKWSVKDLDKIKTYVDDVVSKTFVSKLETVAKIMSDDGNDKKLTDVIIDVFLKKNK